eukprot:Skav220895  [mRNA]  locus=scaffold3880:87722:90575:+ [translate_table: standard]
MTGCWFLFWQNAGDAEDRSNISVAIIGMARDFRWDKVTGDVAPPGRTDGGRSNISVAIIGMARDFRWDKVTGDVAPPGRTDGGRCPPALAPPPPPAPGYAATQLLGGQLADALGAKWVLAAGLSCWSLATALTPWAAAAGAAPLLVVRLALGLGEGEVGMELEGSMVVG